MFMAYLCVCVPAIQRFQPQCCLQQGVVHEGFDTMLCVLFLREGAYKSGFCITCILPLADHFLDIRNSLPLCPLH